MHSNQPFGRRPMFSALGGGGPMPKDLWVLLGVIFVTYSMQAFEPTAIIPALLRLSPLVWQLGLVWQLVTYPFAGAGQASIWILVELFILYIFARDVFGMLGRRRFWELILISAFGAAVVAVGVELVIRGVAQLTGGAPGLSQPFILMSGQRMIITIVIAAFATLRRDATILLFFVLPIQARYFLGLEIVIAFIGFLNTKDFSGFLGVCAAVGIAYSLLTRRRLSGGLRELRLRVERWLIKLKLARMRRRSGLRVVKDDPQDRDRWVH